VTPIPLDLSFVDNGALENAFLVLCRLSPVIFLFPGIGNSFTPRNVKVASLVVLIVIFTPNQTASNELTFSWLLAAREVLIGFSIGFGLKILIWILQISGSIIAQTVSLSQIFGTPNSDPLPTIGQILQVSGICAFFTFGLHLNFIKLIEETYSIAPFFASTDTRRFAAWKVSDLNDAFRIAFGLAAPFIALSVIYNLTIGAINRAMPQLMVALIGAPMIILVALLLLIVSTVTIIEAWVLYVNGHLDTFFNGTPN